MKRKYMLISYFLILTFLIPLLLLNTLLSPKGEITNRMLNKIIPGDYQTTQKTFLVIDDEITNIKKIKISITKNPDRSSDWEYERFQYKMYFYTDKLEEIKTDVYRTKLDDRLLVSFKYKEKFMRLTIIIAPNCINIHTHGHIYHEDARDGLYYDGLVLTLTKQE